MMISLIVSKERGKTITSSINMGSYLLHLPPLIGAQLKEEARGRAFFGQGKELGLKEFRAKKVKEKIFCGILINTKNVV